MKQEGGFLSHGLLQYSFPVGFFQGTSGPRESVHVPEGSCMVFNNSSSEMTSMLSANILFFGSMSPSPHIQGRIVLTHTEIIYT